MDNNTFFINAVRARAHFKRAWLIRVFGVAMDDPNKPPEEDWTVVRSAVGVSFKTAEGPLEPLPEASLGVPLFRSKTTVYAPPNFFNEWPEGGFTTAGNLIYNATAIWPVVGNTIPYQHGRVEQKKIEAIFTRMIDDPENREDREPTHIYVSDWLKYGQAIKYLEETAPLFVTTLSRASIVPNKEVLARKKVLLEEAAANGTLNDPVTQAKIFKELEDLDAKFLANDPGAFFITSGKSKLARRKLTILYGSEQGLDVSQKPLLITQSLHDGLRPEHMVDVMNVSRAGSFDRGSETMLGGVEAKWGDRDMFGFVVQQEDCGTTLGYTFIVTPRTVKDAIGRYMMTNEGLVVIDNAAKALALVGKEITVRSPGRCAAGPSTKWCVPCLGTFLGANPRALGLAVSAYGSGFLQLFLQSMHSKAAVSVKLRVRDLMS